MTTAALSPSKSYVEDGTTLNFAVPFRYLAGADLTVDRISAAGAVTRLVLGVGYSATAGATDAGGTLTLLSTVSGAKLRIRRATARNQSTDYTTNDTFPAESHEAALDRAMLIDQEQDVSIADTATRALLVPDGEMVSTLPPLALRAGKFMAFDADGNPVPATGSGGDSALRVDLAAIGGSQLVSEVPAGIAADNVTNDGPALAARTQSIIMPRQTHYISTSQNIDVDMECRPGTLIRLANGVILTPRAGFVGSKEQIFIPEGTGKVNLRQAKLHEAHAEWWPMPGGDATAAINAALIAHQMVTLFARDYVTTSELILQDGFQMLRGAECPSYKAANTATRILATSATARIIRVGVVANPGSANASPNQCRVRNLFLSRNIAPDNATGASGLAVLFSLEAEVENVWSDASIYPFFFSGSTACRVKDVRALRTVAAVPATDNWVGYYGEGSSGLSGINSNASLIFEGTNIGQCSLAGANTTHLKLDGAKTDFFNNGLFETVGASVGVDVVGSATDGQNNNIDLGRMVLDQGLVRGLRITNIPAGGRVTAKRIYVGLDAGSGIAMEVTGCVGEVSIPEAEIYQGKSTGVGISVTSSAALDLKAWVKDCRSAAASLSGLINSAVDIKVQQTAQNLSAGVQAVANVTDCDIAVSAQAALSGRTMSIGYQSLANTNDRNTINLRKIGSLFSSKRSLAGGAETNSTFVNGV